MGLDMYLSATKWNGGGYSHHRNDYIHDPERKKPVEIVPKAKVSREVRQFNAIIRSLGFGKADDFLKEYSESNSFSISLAVAYWRKANAIHRWFVENVQEGKDDCGKYEVSRSQLEQLRDICKIVLGTVNKGEPVTETDFFGNEYTSYPNASLDVEVAKEALGTQSGFFFGSTEYDQWYIADLESTVEQLDRILNDKRFAGWDFEYQSSW